VAIRVKPEYAHIRIGFNNSSARLGERNDLHKLYEVAKIKNHKAHLDMFEEVDPGELDAIKEKEFMQKQESKKR
jgi:hypothetical protein